MFCLAFKMEMLCVSLLKEGVKQMFFPLICWVRNLAMLTSDGEKEEENDSYHYLIDHGSIYLVL